MAGASGSEASAPPARRRPRLWLWLVLGLVALLAAFAFIRRDDIRLAAMDPGKPFPISTTPPAPAVTRPSWERERRGARRGRRRGPGRGGAGGRRLGPRAGRGRWHPGHAAPGLESTGLHLSSSCHGVPKKIGACRCRCRRCAREPRNDRHQPDPPPASRPAPPAPSVLRPPGLRRLRRRTRARHDARRARPDRRPACSRTRIPDRPHAGCRPPGA